MDTLLKETVANPGRDTRVPPVSFFRNLAGAVCAVVAGMASIASAAERTPDGLGLVDALTGTAVSGDPWPFRWSAAAMSGGSAGNASGHAIVRTGANTWAPECVYQLERYGWTMSATFTNLVPEASYTLELHLTENFYGGSNGSGGVGNRVWSVAANGTSLEANIDIFKEAGAAYTALCKQYPSVKADKDGRIVVDFTTSNDNAHYSGLALFGSAKPSVPTLKGATPTGTQDLAFDWAACTDVHRYYLEKAETAEGPWTGVQTLTPEATSVTLANAYDAAKAVAYRLVASNGVGTAVSGIVPFTPPAGTGLKTRGETIASDAAAFYRLGTVAADDAPANALASDDVSALGYLLDVNAVSPLALASGQTFRTGTLGVGAAGGTLSVTGAGTLAPLNDVLNLSVAAGVLAVETPVAGSGNARIAKNGAGRATLAGGLSGVARLAVNAGALISSNAADGTFAVPLTGAGTFEKMGAGTLTVMERSPDFAGDVVVREGTLRFGATGSAYANAEGTLTVEPGAALDVAASGLGNEKVNLGARTVVVSGAGPDGKGAIVNGGGQSQYNALKNGSLAGDVVFGGDSATLNATVGRWDFRGGALALNGYNITKVGSNMVCLTGMKLTTGDNPVTIDVQEGYWSSETSTDYTQGPENKLRVRKGAVLDFYSMSKPVSWTLDLEDGAGVRFRYGENDAGMNHVAGPLTLPSGTVDVSVLESVYGSFDGPISGEGRLRVANKSGGRLSLSGTNTYAGGTWVQGGNLYAAHKKALPDWNDSAKLTVTNATLILAADKGAWTAEDAKVLAEGGQLVGESPWLGVSVKGEPVVWNADLVFPEDKAGSFAKYDAGQLTLDGRLALPGALNVHGGTLVLTGAREPESGARRLSVYGATLVLTNDAPLTLSSTSGENSRIGSSGRTTLAEVRVSTGATLRAEPACALNPENVGSAGILVGMGDDSRGLLVVEDDGTVRHKVNLGMSSSRAQGAVHQFGGFVENQGGASNDIRVGNEGYGYYELDDGELDWWGYGTIGSGASATGVFVQHGGLFRFAAKTSGRLGLSRGGSGTFYMDGGLVDWTKGDGFLALGESDDNGRGSDGRTTFTVDGTGEARFGNKTTWFGNREDHTAVLNLNGGGVLECGALKVNASFDTNRETVVALLNFDGGTFRAAGNNSLFPTVAEYHADAVTLYAGGAVFDASNFTLTVNHPLTAASGSGVAAIELPAAIRDATGYIGAPFVKISGGGGRGATALCLYDAQTRTVTGIKITSPGTGYTSAPTATISGGGYTNAYTVAATLAPNVTTGGVTVRSSTGTGTVVLAAENAFSGEVAVESGTLRLGAAGAFPKGNDLRLAGGTFDGAGQMVTAGVVRVTSGVLRNVRLVCTRLEKTGEGTLELEQAELVECGNLSLAGGLKSVCRPGLYEDVLSGQDNWTGTIAYTNVQSQGPVKANTTEGWKDYTTAVYTGYIWNRSDADVTWSFMEHFDDRVRVWIDGTLVLSNDTWDVASAAAFTLTPGSHRFEARFGQGSGGAGPVGTTYGFGIGLDREGRTELTASNFEKLANPEVNGGPLFTTEPREVMPLADPTVTTADLTGAFAFTGTWTVDMAQVCAGGRLTVTDGALDLSAVTDVVFTNTEDLPKGGVYVLAESVDGFTLGDTPPVLTGLPAGPWRFEVHGTKLRLAYPAGTTFILR